MKKTENKSQGTTDTVEELNRKLFRAKLSLRQEQREFAIRAFRRDAQISRQTGEYFEIEENLAKVNSRLERREAEDREWDQDFKNNVEQLKASRSSINEQLLQERAELEGLPAFVFQDPISDEQLELRKQKRILEENIAGTERRLTICESELEEAQDVLNKSGGKPSEYTLNYREQRDLIIRELHSLEAGIEEILKEEEEDKEHHEAEVSNLNAEIQRLEQEVSSRSE
jgi:chromosome segregation ATPase